MSDTSPNDGVPRPYDHAPGAAPTFPPYHPPPSLDMVSVAGLLFAVLCIAPVGIVLGLIGLGRTRRGRRTGRVFAWLAVGVGSFLTVLQVLIIAILVLLPEHSDDYAWDDIAVGTCHDEVDDTIDAVEIELVPCDETHDVEIFHIYDLTVDPWPGQDAVDLDGLRTCRVHFEEYVGIPYDESSLLLRFYTPTKEQFEANDRSVACGVRTNDGLIGSAEGSER